MPGPTAEDEAVPSRRAVLGGALGTGLLAAAAACTRGGDDPPRPAPTPAGPDPVAPLLAAHEDLLGAYDATLARHPALSARLAPVRQEHAEHVAALRSLLRDGGGPGSGGTSPSRTPSSTPSARPVAAVSASPAAALAALARSEGAAQTALAAAALTVRAGETAAVLGSVAASEASHAVVLR